MSQQVSDIKIRTANLSDAQAIATIHIAAWKAAYINIVPQAHLDNLCFDDRLALWQRILSDPVFAGSILVAEKRFTQETTEILGFVSFGAAAVTATAATPSLSNEANDEIAETAELRAIYIDPKHWARGIGQRLWEAAEQQLNAAKYKSVVVRVFANNQRAIRFYHAAGFVEGDEEGVIEIGGKKLEILWLRKELV